MKQHLKRARSADQSVADVFDNSFLTDGPRQPICRRLCSMRREIRSNARHYQQCYMLRAVRHGDSRAMLSSHALKHCRALRYIAAR